MREECNELFIFSMFSDSKRQITPAYATLLSFKDIHKERQLMIEIKKEIK